MNKQEATEFLKIVTGRKIKMNCWREGAYLIPTGEWHNTLSNNPHYWTFRCIDEKGEKYCYFIRNGFEESEPGVKWVIAETFDDYLERYHNE